MKKEFNLIVILITIVLSIFLLSSLVGSIKEGKLKKNLKPEYDKAILKIDNLNQELQRCEEAYDDKKNEYQILKCDYEKNKRKERYDTCVLFSTRDICLYENNYKKINCSIDNVRKGTTGLTGFLFSIVPPLGINCKNISDEIIKTNDIIQKYELL